MMTRAIPVLLNSEAATLETSFPTEGQRLSGGAELPQLHTCFPILSSTADGQTVGAGTGSAPGCMRDGKGR